MLSHGDRVLIAVSGGVDSLVSAWVLQQWRRKAPISYELLAVHVANPLVTDQAVTDAAIASIARQVTGWGVAFFAVPGWALSETAANRCFQCARNRRSQLFELARQHGYTTVAFGHHKDDLVETLLLNALYSGNLSTMLPRQDLFGGNLRLIRVLAYLEKREVRMLAELAGIEPVADRCPLQGDTRRATVRKLLQQIGDVIPGAKASLFAALANVRPGYLLTDEVRTNLADTSADDDDCSAIQPPFHVQEP